VCGLPLGLLASLGQIVIDSSVVRRSIGFSSPVPMVRPGFAGVSVGVSHEWCPVACLCTSEADLSAQSSLAAVSGQVWQMYRRQQEFAFGQ